MTDKKSNDSRRKLLKSIAAGSGAVVAGKTLPEAWTKPIVDSVLLPAHAATSLTLTCKITTDSNKISYRGGSITGIKTTVSPATAGVLLLCTPSVNGVPSDQTSSAETDANGVASFSDIDFDDFDPAPEIGDVITLTDSLDPDDTSGASLTPCSTDIMVVGKILIEAVE